MAEDNVNLILVELAKIQTSLETALESIDDHEDRLRAIEARGGKRWDALSEKIIMALAGGIVGWLLGQIIEIL